jgi:hypothetical protein
MIASLRAPVLRRFCAGFAPVFRYATENRRAGSAPLCAGFQKYRRSVEIIGFFEAPISRGRARGFDPFPTERDSKDTPKPAQKRARVWVRWFLERVSPLFLAPLTVRKKNAAPLFSHPEVWA